MATMIDDRAVDVLVAERDVRDEGVGTVNGAFLFTLDSTSK